MTKLSLLRQSTKTSQASVSAEIGVGQGHYHKIEHGRLSVTAPTANRLADFFGVSVETLFHPSRYVATPEVVSPEEQS